MCWGLKIVLKIKRIYSLVFRKDLILQLQAYHSRSHLSHSTSWAPTDFLQQLQALLSRSQNDWSTSRPLSYTIKGKRGHLFYSCWRRERKHRFLRGSHIMSPDPHWLQLIGWCAHPRSSQFDWGMECPVGVRPWTRDEIHPTPHGWEWEKEGFPIGHLGFLFQEESC